MAIVVEAVYEDGVLKPAQPLPLGEHEAVRIVVQAKADWVDEAYGILGWTGPPSDLRYLAEDVELDPQEAP
jgi:predicted DNA-binding antitoxin AbrB/MazE fold protein